MGVSGGADVAARVSGFVTDHRDDYGYVVATRDHHIDPGAHFSDEPDFVTSWPRHCVVGTTGAEFHPGFDASRVDAIFGKGEYTAAYSGFEGSDEEGRSLEDWLRERGVTEVDVVGIATDHCVRATVLDARSEGFDARVLSSLIAGVDAGRSGVALDEMRAAGATIV